MGTRCTVASLLLLFIQAWSADSLDLVALACQRNPTLSFCDRQVAREQSNPNRRTDFLYRRDFIEAKKEEHLKSQKTREDSTLFWPDAPAEEKLYTGYGSFINPNDDTSKAKENSRGVLGHKSVKTASRAHAVPVVPSDAAFAGSAGEGAADPFKAFDGYTDSRGVLHRPRSTSPFSKPGLWEPNPADPHSRDPANKYWYHPESVGVDWLNGQLQWGAHWAVPAAGVGGTDGMSALHFPSIGTFLNIPDDYD